MSPLKKIELAVSQLPPKELEEFADWFEEFQETAFDRAIEKTANNCALSDLAAAALLAHKKGETKEI